MPLIWTMNKNYDYQHLAYCTDLRCAHFIAKQSQTLVTKLVLVLPVV